MKPLQEGDRVRLKGGGPPMTVIAAKREHDKVRVVHCIWNAEGEMLEDDFDPTSVELVERGLGAPGSPA